MSYYCTLADLLNRKGEDMIVQFSDDDGDESPDDDVINAALEWAYNEINAALTERYSAYLPFTSGTLPGIIYNTAITFSVYLLGYRLKDEIQDGSALSKEYDEARERLQEIADGEMLLQLADGTLANDAKGGTSKQARMSPDVTDTNYDPIWSRDKLYNYAERRN